jgi:hypothetical protein
MANEILVQVFPIPTTVTGILSDKLVRTGYASQQVANQSEDPGRLDNLWEPVDGPGGDRGAHGPFDYRAHRHCLQTWVTLYRARLVVCVVLLVLVALILTLLFGSGLPLHFAQ